MHSKSSTSVNQELFCDLHRNSLQTVQKHTHQIVHREQGIRYRYDLYRRSIFGVTHIYNNLPQQLVDCKTVQNFQSLLTGMAKVRIERHQWYV